MNNKETCRHPAIYQLGAKNFCVSCRSEIVLVTAERERLDEK